MSLWPINVHINFYFKGHVWTRSFEVRVATRVRELKELILENGQKEDIDSMELLAYGERVPDYTLIWHEVTWDFNLLHAEIGALRAEEDRQQAKELGQTEKITTENFPCTECGTPGAKNFGDGEFAYTVYCNSCWKAWGLEVAVEEEPVASEPPVEEREEAQDEKPTAKATAKAAGRPAAKGAAKASAKALAKQGAGGDGAPKAAAKSAAAKSAAAKAAPGVAAKAGAKAAAKASAKAAAAPKELSITVLIDADLEMSMQIKAKPGSTLGELKAALATMGVAELPEAFSLGQAAGGGALPDDTALTEEHLELQVVE